MHIKSLFLKNFRNYEQEEILFTDGINILTGANAQGKTNSAEAIFFLCTGYSPRANRDKLLVRHGQELAEIRGVASSKYGDVSVRIDFNKNDKKTIYVNELQVLKIGELLGNINSVFFNPSELKLVQESPEDRRRFLNVSLSQMHKNYFYALQRYNKILAQRNNLLKDPDKYIIKETLPIWDVQMAKEASKIIRCRNDFLTQISPIAEQKHALLSDGKETLKMKTESGYSGTEEEIAEALKNDLKECLERDMRLGFTTIGPHRDDIKFTLNGDDVRVFGSQGQQRTVALSLKLAETESFYLRFGEYPILILDDVLSELDKKRQRKLISSVEHLQTVFTATGLDRTVFKDKAFNRIIIENGKVKKR
jgi:DNA replication and repair protein RecF